MAIGNVVMPARYKLSASSEDPGVKGILIMTRDKFIFSSPDNPTSNTKLNVDFTSKTGFRFTKEGGKNKPLLNLTDDPKACYIFEFDNFSERNVCQEFVKKVLENIKQHDKRLLSTEEIELRIKVLSKDNDLKKLHKRLVIGGILTEAEFWSTRKELLVFDAVPKKQGAVSNVDVKPLTWERIQQIFIEYPAVRQEFSESVPSKRTEDDFWRKYRKAEFIHRTKNAVAAAAEAAKDEELAVFLDILACEARRKMRRVEPTFGLVADVNRHGAAKLVGGTRTSAETLAKYKMADELATEMSTDDEKANLPFAPLFIKDPREYFNNSRHANNALEAQGVDMRANNTINCSLSTKQAYASLRQQICEMKITGLSEPVVKPEVARKVLNGLLTQEHISITNQYNHWENCRESNLDRLPDRTKEELLDHWICIQELLKHFWSSYPITTAYLYTKVRRMKDAMAEINSKLQRIKESAQSGHQVSLLVQPMLQAMDAAFSQYDRVK